MALNPGFRLTAAGAGRYAFRNPAASADSTSRTVSAEEVHVPMSLHTTSHRPTARHGLIAVALAAVLLVFGVTVVRGDILVLFTIDVESTSRGNPERDIWGRLPGVDGEHGITRMMDLFDRHGVGATFFVNVYEAADHGEDALAEVCRTIHTRGHDLQLHTHPGPMFDGRYAMQGASLDRQREILRRGADLIRGWTGVGVVAHRAGGYLADGVTIEACKAEAIAMDFSLNIGWPDSVLGRSGLTRNAPVVTGGVLCVPVTCFYQVKVGPWQSLRFLDIEADTPQEIRHVIEQLDADGVRTAVIMLHSFSFTRGGRVNDRVARDLDSLLADLVADPSVRIVTAPELLDLWRADPGRLVGSDTVPTTGLWLTYQRSWQRLNEGWKNVVVALGPPAGLVVLLGVALLWRRRRRARRQAARSEATD
jgi:peptidoglycan/xylan/chitin deacetylase (PgdA/CDA1 family)